MDIMKRIIEFRNNGNMEPNSSYYQYDCKSEKNIIEVNCPSELRFKTLETQQLWMDFNGLRKDDLNWFNWEEEYKNQIKMLDEEIVFSNVSIINIINEFSDKYRHMGSSYELLKNEHKLKYASEVRFTNLKVQLLWMELNNLKKEDFILFDFNQYYRYKISEEHKEKASINSEIESCLAWLNDGNHKIPDEEIVFSNPGVEAFLSALNADEEDDIDEMLEERGVRYGDFSTHASITQNIKLVMSSAPKWTKLSTDKKEALEMIAHKLGRILNGDPEYKDSWIDIAGYATLVSNTLKD